MERVHARSGYGARMVEFEVPGGALPPPPARVGTGVARGRGRGVMLSEALTERAWSGAMSGSSSEDESERAAKSQPESQPESPVVVEQTDETEEPTAARSLSTGGERERRRSMKQAVVMVEVWKGDVRGDALTAVSVQGSIRRALAPYNVDRVLFRVRPSGSLAVDACLHAASQHRKYVRARDAKDDEVTFSAALSGIPIDATYLKYALPSAAVRPPLQASLVVGTPDTTRQAATLLVCVPYAVDPALSGSVSSLVDVSVTVSFPPDVDGMVKTSHAAEWCPIQSRAQWTFARLEAGESGVVRAVVSFKRPPTAAGETDTNETTRRICAGISATVLFSGRPGSSFSGLGLDISGDDDDGIGEGSFWSGNVRTFGELSLRVG